MFFSLLTALFIPPRPLTSVSSLSLLLQPFLPPPSSLPPAYHECGGISPCPPPPPSHAVKDATSAKGATIHTASVTSQDASPRMHALTSCVQKL